MSQFSIHGSWEPFLARGDLLFSGRYFAVEVEQTGCCFHFSRQRTLSCRYDGGDVAFNVPLNDALAIVDPASPEGATQWARAF